MIKTLIVPGLVVVASIFGAVTLMATAPKLRQHVQKVTARAPQGLVLDLDNVDFIDSTGLGVMVGAAKRMRIVGGGFRIVCNQKHLNELFALTRLDAVFELFETLDECVRTTQVRNLSLLPAGAVTSAGVARFASARFLHFLDQVRGRYGTIILDTPPLVPVADARMLGRLAEMVLLVVRANVTRCDSIDRCLDALGEVSGIVFNDISAGSYHRAYHAYPTEGYGRD